MKEFLQSIYDSYTDRIKSPFIGSFILSFLVFNWRAFAILFFSEWPIHCRIEWIESKFYYAGNFWYPVLIALFYILILPYVNLVFEWILSSYSEKKKNKFNALKVEELIRRKGEAKHLREIADAQAGTSEISALNERIVSLQFENNALTTQNQQDLDRHNTALEQFKSRENELLNKIQGLVLQSETEWAKSKLVNKVEMTPQSIKEVISLSETFSDLEKHEYIKFVKDFRENPEFVSIESETKYKQLNLLMVTSKKGKISFELTKLGYMLFEFLNNGRDLN